MKHLLVLFLLATTCALTAQCISGDCQNGTGTFLYPSGAKYVGEFQDGIVDGIGACYYTDGSVYRGNWRDRYPHGEGIKFFADGTKWQGTWRRGQPVDARGNLITDLTGKGETADDLQSGCLEGNCQNGSGVYAYPDGSRYAGAFQKGKPQGQGDLTYPDKTRYVGAFADGLPHGEGVEQRPDGKQVVGVWREGTYIGNPRIDYGRDGCIAGDCANGRGVFVYTGGTGKYTGTFKNNLPHGKGVAFYKNGERYEGGWRAGSFHGAGILSLMDGSEVSGTWSEGRFVAAPQKAPRPPQKPEPKEEVAEVIEAPSAALTARENAPLPKVWAVVVGVASYQHMRALRYTDDDAYRMYAFLKSPEGGAIPDERIEVLVDDVATKENIKQTLRAKFSQAGPNDLVLLYFSGHGLKGAFLPIDYDGYHQKLHHEEINEILLESPAKYKLVIADACHSGSLLDERSATAGTVIETYYQSLAQAEPGTALLLSSKSSETSLESSGLRQGVFSHFLIRGLKGEADTNFDQLVDLAELFDFIYSNVRTYTNLRQTPVIRGDYDERMTVGVAARRP